MICPYLKQECQFDNYSDICNQCIYYEVDKIRKQFKS